MPRSWAHPDRFGAGPEGLQFSPVDELRIVSETIMRNAQVMQEPGVAADA